MAYFTCVYTCSQSNLNIGPTSDGRSTQNRPSSVQEEFLGKMDMPVAQPPPLDVTTLLAYASTSPVAEAIARNVFAAYKITSIRFRDCRPAEPDAFQIDDPAIFIGFLRHFGDMFTKVAVHFSNDLGVFNEQICDLLVTKCACTLQALGLSGRPSFRFQCERLRCLFMYLRTLVLDLSLSLEEYVLLPFHSCRYLAALVIYDAISASVCFGQIFPRLQSVCLKVGLTNYAVDFFRRHQSLTEVFVNSADLTARAGDE